MSLDTTIKDIETILKGCTGDQWEVRMQLDELRNILSFLQILQMVEKTQSENYERSVREEQMKQEEERRRQRSQQSKFDEMFRQYGEFFRHQSAFEDLFRNRSYEERFDFGNRADAKAWYSVLGVPQTATNEEIKKAYLRLRTKNHPDKHPKASEKELKRLNETFREVLQAWETVKQLRGLS